MSSLCVISTKVGANKEFNWPEGIEFIENDMYLNTSNKILKFIKLSKIDRKLLGKNIKNFVLENFEVKSITSKYEYIYDNLEKF